MNKAIEVKGLKKSYGSVEAVKGIDFYAEEGGLLAFLGPNGAGKSTTIDIICTFLKPDAGEIEVNGIKLGTNDAEIRKRIGAVFQDGLLDKRLTVAENLRARGGLYGLKGKELSAAVERTANLCGITELLKRPYGKLSGGQRRRCDIARALIHTPKILFLDEPTTGLDPQTRKHIWETIANIRRDTGMTVFLTTHYMEEAADADYVIVIDDGRIAAKGTPAQLKEKYSRDKLILVTESPQEIEKYLAGRTYAVKADTVEVSLASTLEALEILDGCREYLEGFEVVKGTMDDAFLAITGKEIRE